MQAAVEVAQAHGPDGHAFHQPALAADIDHVADIDGAFEHEERAGDDVLDQRLRAEADRQADHAGACQQRRDVDADLGQDDQDRHRGDDDEEGIPDQRQQRADACRAQDGMPRIILPVEVRIDDAAQDLPRHQRQHQHDDDIRNPAQHLAPDLPEQQAAHVDAPGGEDQQDGGDPHRIGDDAPQDRDIAIGPRGDDRIARNQRGIDAGEAIEQPRQPFLADRDRSDHQGGDDGRAQQIEESAGDVESPDQIDADDIDDHRHVPDLGQPRANDAGHDAPSALDRPAADPVRHRLAVLQHEDHEHGGHDEAKEP